MTDFRFDITVDRARHLLGVLRVFVAAGGDVRNQWFAETGEP
jgi:hypothetical protein